MDAAPTESAFWYQNDKSKCWDTVSSKLEDSRVNLLGVWCDCKESSAFKLFTYQEVWQRKLGSEELSKNSVKFRLSRGFPEPYGSKPGHSIIDSYSLGQTCWYGEKEVLIYDNHASTVRDHLLNARNYNFFAAFIWTMKVAVGGDAYANNRQYLQDDVQPLRANIPVQGKSGGDNIYIRVARTDAFETFAPLF